MTGAAVITRFLQDETGSVTVDWVVLTAAIAGLALGVFAAIEVTMGGVTAEMSADMERSNGLSELAAGAPVGGS